MHFVPLIFAEERLFGLGLTENNTPTEPAEKPLSRAQKKNARKKQKKKEKKSSEVAFEIEEITTSIEAVSLDEKSPNRESSTKTEEKVKMIIAGIFRAAKVSV